MQRELLAAVGKVTVAERKERGAAARVVQPLEHAGSSVQPHVRVVGLQHTAHAPRHQSRLQHRSKVLGLSWRPHRHHAHAREHTLDLRVRTGIEALVPACAAALEVMGKGISITEVK